MANIKNITDVPVATSIDGLNFLVNDNGSAKQIAASAVGAQADWNETDETSPAFIMNKPTGGSVVSYYLTNNFLWKDSGYTDAVTLSEFQNAFMSGIVRLRNSSAVGTIIGYVVTDNNKIALIYNLGYNSTLNLYITNYVSE